MALEVINSLKEAERKADRIINDAEAQKKEIIKNADKRAMEEYAGINAQGNSEVKRIIDAAVLEGQQLAAPIVEKGKEEEEAILNVSEDRLFKAINLVIERIVNTNGNS